MKLRKILDNISATNVVGSLDKNILDITNNSQKVVEGSAFFAVKGIQFDGVKFVDDAISRGAKVVFHESDIEKYQDGITYVKVENLRKKEPFITSFFYGNPEKEIAIIGVTGTNGKSSTVSIIHFLLNRLGKKCGAVGTIAYDDGKDIYTPTHTTPDSFVLSKLFRSMVNNGCNYCVMEVSSHSLVMDRVSHIKFDRVLFTNISQDHLDFHVDMKSYAEAKSILLNNLLKKDGVRIISKPRDYYNILLSKVDDRDIVIDGKKIKIDSVEQSDKGTIFNLVWDKDFVTIESKLFGKFQSENLALSYLALKSLGFKSKDILENIKRFKNISGRMERVGEKKLIFIDYAHTPEALKKVLETAKDIPHSKIITVFGCGGDRDRSKRGIMGNIATTYSDLSIITDDNPRFEDSDKIISDIEKGVVKGSLYKIVSNRREAIRTAIGEMNRDDILIIAGKGHENYQDICGVKRVFSDRDTVLEFLNDKH